MATKLYSSTVQNPSRNVVDGLVLGLVALGGVMAWQNIPEFRNSIKGVIGKLPLAGGPSGPTGGATGGIPEASIQAWASGIGVPYEVGRRFVAEFGRLPTGIPELTNWGNARGYRSADGRWLISGGAPAAPSAGGGGGGVSSNGGGGINNPNLGGQMGDWKRERVEEGQSPGDWNEFRAHQIRIGAPDPGAFPVAGF